MKKREVNHRPERVEFKKADPKKRALKYSVIVVLILAVVALVVYMLSFQFSPCSSYGCFETGMKSCKRVVYINDEPQATWRYKVLGLEDGQCKINVELIGAKEGELMLEELVGFDMDCLHDRGLVRYPERDMRNCHGRLKEEFQAITIERLHKIVVENLQEIGEELVPQGF